MQILTFVSVTLMVMAIITYARLEHFLNFQVMNSHYQPYIEQTQREGFNRGQKANYDADHVSEGKEKESVGDAAAKLSFFYILNKDVRNNKPEITRQHLEIAKNLMKILYSKHEFFEEINKNPGLLDQLLKELMESVDEKIEKKRAQEGSRGKQANIARIRDLGKVELASPELGNVLYKMLRATMKETAKPQKEIQKIVDLTIDEEDLEIESDEDSKDEQSQSKEGDFSLFDYITLKEGPKIRMFLTSREMLQAIYGESSPAVDEVIKVRGQLYYQVKKGKMDPDVANQKFRDSFRTQTPNWLKEEEILDFTIKKPKTPPKSENAEKPKKNGSKNNILDKSKK